MRELLGANFSTALCYLIFWVRIIGVCIFESVAGVMFPCD